jgi:uncharacterized protein
MSSLPDSRLRVVLFSGIGLLVAVALVVAGMMLAQARNEAVAHPENQQLWIAVCGHGKAKAAPDQAQLNLGVFATATTVHDVRSQTSQTMSSVLAALKGNGVAEQDIQTGYVSLQPEYNYQSSPPRLSGYSATNTITVTIRNLANVGAIMDAAVEQGGSNIFVGGILFSAGDPAQARSDAQRDAVADAKQKAEQAAGSAGAKLGPVLSIQVGGCGNDPQTPTYGAVDRGTQVHKATTPIEPGQNDVSVDVTVVYALR